MQIFHNNQTAQTNYVLRAMPVRIEYQTNNSTQIVFDDGSVINSGCLGCKNPKCMEFSLNEIGNSVLGGLSIDRNRSVCPVNAIEWNNEHNMPIVNNDKCIRCGICIKRCPLGAIYYDGDIKNSFFEDESNLLSSTDEEQKAFIDALKDVNKCGVLINESDELLIDIYQRISCLSSSYYNIIGRNLLISLCCDCAISRKGDVYTRMDAVYSSVDGCFGPVEIEFGSDTLDASRGILDDIAVLHKRHGVDKSSISPLVICLSLPNGRQGYWQVVKDIKDVEDIHVQTVTIGSLMILVWNRKWLMPDDVTYYIDYDNMSLRHIINWQIGRSTNISDKLLGILEPNR